MRRVLSSLLTPLLVLGFAGGAAAAEPKLQLSDDGLPLQEIRPNDRRDYVLVLDGKWSEPALPGVDYYVNLFFPDGSSYSHKVLDERLFALGEVRVLLPEHLLRLHGVANGGTIEVVVSARQPAVAPTSSEVITSPFTVSWPMKRPVVQQLIRSKRMTPGPVDVFPGPEPTPPPTPQPSPPPEIKKG